MISNLIYWGRSIEQLKYHIQIGFYGGEYSVNLKNGETKTCKCKGVDQQLIYKQIYHAFKEIQNFGVAEFGIEFDLTRYWKKDSGNMWNSKLFYNCFDYKLKSTFPQVLFFLFFHVFFFFWGVYIIANKNFNTNI